jgi:hypothetical protein
MLRLMEGVPARLKGIGGEKCRRPEEASETPNLTTAISWIVPGGEAHSGREQ